jgi:hypothetical protein
VALVGVREAVLLVALHTVVVVVEAVGESRLMAVVGLVDHGMPCAGQREAGAPYWLGEWAGRHTGESSMVGRVLGLTEEVALGKSQEAGRNHLDRRGDIQAGIVLAVALVEEGVNLVRKSAKAVGRKVVEELDRSVQNENSLEVVVVQVASAVTAASQEAEHKGFGAMMRLMLFDCAPLGEAEVDCCTATGWVAEVLATRSYACHGPSVTFHDPGILCELLGDTMEQH